MRLYLFGVLFVLLSSRAFCETLDPNQENGDSFSDTSSASASYEEDEDDSLSGQIDAEQEYPNLYSGEEAPRDYEFNTRQSLDDNVAYWQSIYGTEDVPEFEVPPDIDGDTIFLDLGDLTGSSDDEEATVVKRNSGKASPDFFHGSSQAREGQSLDDSWRSGNLDYRGMMTNVYQPQFHGENSWPDPKTMPDFQSDENEQSYGTQGASSFSETNHRGSSWASENFRTIDSGRDSAEIDGEMETAESRSFRMNNKAIESLLNSKRKVIQAKKDLINVAVSGGSKAELSHAFDKTIEAKQGLIDEVISGKADGNFKQRKKEFIHSLSGFDHAQSFSKNTKISGSQSANFRSVLDSKRKVIQAKKDLIHAAAAGSSKAQLNDAVVKTLDAKKDSLLYNSVGTIHKKSDIAHSTCCKAKENFFGEVHRKQGVSLNTDSQINGQIHTDLQSGFSNSLNQHAAELSSGVAYHDEKNSLQSSLSGASNIGVGARIGVRSSSGNNIHKEGSSLNLSKNIQSNSQISSDLELGSVTSQNLHQNNLAVSKNSGIGISSGITTVHDQQNSLHSSLNGASNIGVGAGIGVTSSSGNNIHKEGSSLNLSKNIQSNSQISGDLQLGTLTSLDSHKNNLAASKNSGIGISSGITMVHDQESSLDSSLNAASNLGVGSDIGVTNFSGKNIHKAGSSLNLSKNIQTDGQISSDLHLGSVTSQNFHENNLAVTKNSEIEISSGVTTVHDQQNSLHSSLNGASNIEVGGDIGVTSSVGKNIHEQESSPNLSKNVQSNSQISSDIQMGSVASQNSHQNDLDILKNSEIGISSGITTVYDHQNSLHSSLSGASDIGAGAGIGVTSTSGHNFHNEGSSLNLSKKIQRDSQISSDLQSETLTSQDLHDNNLAVSKNSEIGISSGISKVHEQKDSLHSSLHGASNIGVGAQIGEKSPSGNNIHKESSSLNLSENIQSDNQISSDLHLGTVTSQDLHQNDLAIAKTSDIGISSEIATDHDHQNSLHSSLNGASNVRVGSDIGVTSSLDNDIHEQGSSLNLNKKLQTNSQISSDLRLESSTQSEIDSLESSDQNDSYRTEGSEIKFNGATNIGAKTEIELESDSDSSSEEINGSLSATGEIQSSNEYAGSSNFNRESKTHTSENSEVKTSLNSGAALSTNLGIGSLVHSDLKTDGKIGVGLSTQLNTQTAKTVEEKSFLKPEENVETEWTDNSKSIHKECASGTQCGISGKLHVDLNSKNENSYAQKNRLETITEQDVPYIPYKKSKEYSTSEDNSFDLEVNKDEETHEDVSRTISVTKNAGIHVDHDVVSELSLNGNRESINSLNKNEENRSSHKEAFGNFNINSDHDLKTRIVVHKELEHPEHSIAVEKSTKPTLQNQEDRSEATDQNSRYQLAVNFDNLENNSDHEHQTSTYAKKFGKHYSNAAHQHHASQNTKTLSHFQSCFHESSPFPEDVEYYDTDQTFSNPHCRLIDLDVNCSGMTAFMRPECQQLNANVWHPQGSGSPITLWTVKSYLNHGQELAIEMHNRAKWLCNQGLIPKLHTPAMLHFINNLATENTVEISHESEVSLFGTKLLQQRLSSDFDVTPNTFVEFLQHHAFRVIGTGLCQARPKRCPPNQMYRSFDGSCNNQKHPTWGQCNTAFVRILPARYADGVHRPPKSVTGIALPNPRALSVRCFSRKLISDRKISLAVSQWGQVLSHDFAMQTIDQTVEGGIECCADGKRQLPKKYQHHSCLPINIPEDDEFYSKFRIRCMNFVRSMTISREDCTLGPADQLNTVTSYLDASPLYGSNKETCDQLRAFKGGRMLVAIRQGRELLPVTTNRSRFCDVMSPNEVCYRAGDVRVNQNPQLAVMQTALLREHNRIADALSALNPHWEDERVFQESRRIVIAEYQHITYNEWVPLVIGKKYCQIHRLTSECRNKMSRNYDPRIKAATINSFSTAAFRFFHSMVEGNINLCPASREISHTLRLSNHFFRPQIIERDNNLDDLIRGLVSQPMHRADDNFHPEIAEYLFRSRNEFGMDLEAMDIQRGRDHGLPGYNSYRKICGLRRARDFDDLIREIPQEKIEKLKKLYAHVDDIDLIVGSIMERKTSGNILGPTVRCLLGEQFYRSKIGDRYFYDNADQPHSFTQGQFEEIAKASFARLLCDTGDNIENIQAQAFRLPSEKNPLKLCCALPEVDLSLWKESGCE